ncbi:MAG: pentapeptide repeat-containing protein, partial [Bacteroidota bacterium]
GEVSFNDRTHFAGMTVVMDADFSNATFKTKADFSDADFKGRTTPADITTKSD